MAENSSRCPKSPTGGHYWMIEGQDGPTSDGVCKYCGESRRFSNSVDIGRRPLPSTGAVKEVA